MTLVINYGNVNSMPDKISAIDIGSNAIRMIIGEIRDHQVRILKKFRSPVRLGADVFKDGVISESTLEKAEETFMQFADLNRKYNIKFCRAVATSATREAKNKTDFVHRIFTKSKIKIEVIDGTKEAELIFSAVKHEVALEQKNVILIDVGGGSVEITHCQKAKLAATQSFPLGTVRLLDELRRKKMNESNFKVIIGDHLSEVHDFIKSHLPHESFDFAVGTGGNLECMARLKLDLLKKTPNTYCTLDELMQISDGLLKMSVKDRIEKLRLRPDRADVIIPAILVVKSILRQTNTQKILIPCVGLRDGLMRSLVSKPQY